MQVSNYGIEEIPDTARLYYRVHKNIYMATVRAAGIPQGKLPSGVFRFPRPTIHHFRQQRQPRVPRRQILRR